MCLENAGFPVGSMNSLAGPSTHSLCKMGSKTLRDVDNHSLLTWHPCLPTATPKPERETNAESPHLKHLCGAQAVPSWVFPLAGICVLLPWSSSPCGSHRAHSDCIVQRLRVAALCCLTHTWPFDPGMTDLDSRLGQMAPSSRPRGTPTHQFQVVTVTVPYPPLAQPLLPYE